MPLFSFTMASVHTCAAVLCCHSNTQCLAAFVSRAQAGRRRRGGGANGGSRAEDIQVMDTGVTQLLVENCIYTENHQVFWNQSVCRDATRRRHSFPRFCFVRRCVSTSPSLPLPADHIPPPVPWPFLPNAGRGHISSMTDFAMKCGDLGKKMHILIYTYMQVNTTPTSLFNISKMRFFFFFFTSVSIFFFSNGFHFWYFNVCDTAAQRNKMWTWQCRNNRLRANTDKSVPLYVRLHLFLSLPSFICFYVCLRSPCGHSYAVETVASVAKTKPRADWHRILMIPLLGCFFCSQRTFASCEQMAVGSLVQLFESDELTSPSPFGEVGLFLLLKKVFFFKKCIGLVSFVPSDL